jgi:exopolyphosphatase/guanosine-5'-triphosphate,3'-diphosphate pyrophosphatase
VRVGVIDIGSNTARLLVAAPSAGSAVDSVHAESALLALGDEIERFGFISELKLRDTADQARAYARTARELGCRSIEVIVTAPGRQSANADELRTALERATSSPVRVLSAEAEGKLAFEGAVAQAGALPRRVTVCDVGGGSTEVVAGTPAEGPKTCRCLDVGSLRLTRRFLEDDPPRKKAVRAARREVASHFEGLRFPETDAALATGGSARSLRRLTGSRRLDADELAGAVRAIAKTPSVELAADLDLDPVRARTLLAGALILAEVQQRLGVPLEVARGGLREGAAYAMLTQLAAA